MLLAAIAVTLIAVRIYDTQRGPPLELWHTYVPSELTADEIESADWGQYLAAEQALFDDVRIEVTAQLDAGDRIPVNRYFDGSPVYPGSLRTGLEPLVHHGTGRDACRRGGAPAWADRFALQPASHRAPLSSGRLCRGRDQTAGAWHRPNGLDGRRMGTMDGRDASGR